MKHSAKHSNSSSARLLARLGLAATLVLAGACGGGGGGGALTFAYATPAPTYDTCTAIVDNVPTLGTLVPSAFAIDPPLPAGLAFDTGTGVISGTPTTGSTATTYTITATTTRGAATAEVTIEVASTTPAVSYAGGSNVLDVAHGIAFDSGVPNVVDGTPESFAIVSGTLPEGLAFDTMTGVFTGSTHATVTEVLTVEVTDCAGASSQVNVTVDVVEPVARGVWVANGSDGTITTYLRDDANGDLRPTGYAAPQAGDVDVIAVHPSGRFAYASASSSSTLELLLADSADGRLAPTGTTVDLGVAVITDAVVDPRGESLYATTDDGFVHQFSVNTTDGTLTPLVPATVAAGIMPARVVVHRSGDYVYVANEGAQTVSAFTRDAMTGELVFLNDFATGIDVADLALHPNGQLLYASASNNATLVGFDLDTTSGSLAPAPWSPFVIGHAGTQSLAIASTGDFLYGANSVAGIVDQWSLDAVTGEPAPLVNPNVALPAVARSMTLDPRAKTAYVVLADDSVAAFDVDGTTGELAPSNEAFVLGRNGARRIACQPADSTPTWSTVGLFALDTTGSQVFAFGFDDTAGTLLGVNSVVAGTNDCWGIAVHPTRPYLYVSNDNTPAAEGSVVSWSIANDQFLTALSSVGTDASNDALVVDPSGRFLFQSLWDDMEVRAYVLDPATGLLTVGATANVETNPGALAVHPGGGLMLVPNNMSNSISLLSIDPATGALTFESTVAAGTAGPYQVLFHPSGRFAYVVTLATGQIESYAVDLATPSITPIGAPQNDLDLNVRAAISPDGRFLVSVDANSDQIGVWAIDLDPTNVTPDGTLTITAAPTATGFTSLRAVTFDATGQWLVLSNSLGGIQVRPFNAGTIGASADSASPGGFLRDLAPRTQVD